MMNPTEILALAEISLGMTGPIWFLADHWIRKGWMGRYQLPDRGEVSTGSLPRISILLCVRNEARIIEGKLVDLARQDYPRNLLEVLLVDTGSTDGTVQIAEEWASLAPEFGPIVRFLATTGVEGKSAAVNLGLSEVDGRTDIMLMTDADARLAPGTIRRVAEWMANPEVGAVCGRQIPMRTGEDELETYRTFYNLTREAESRYDSTPIFEGSLAAYRRSSIGDIVATSNADDSQLAVQVACRGLRAIHDPELHFVEAVPAPGRGFHQQRLRRAQGVVRHLWRNRSLWFSSGRKGQVHRMNAHAHLFLPWAVLGWSATMIGFQVIHSTELSSNLLLTALWGGNLLIVAGALLGWRQMRDFLHGMYCLALAQTMALFRLSLHRWEPIESTRERIAEFDADYEWPGV